jgi:hypothetical protein
MGVKLGLRPYGMIIDRWCSRRYQHVKTWHVFPWGVPNLLGLPDDVQLLFVWV